MLTAPYVPNLTRRFLAEHEWRPYDTGYTFSVAQNGRRQWQSYQVVAILPREAPNPNKGLAVIRCLRNGRTFEVPLGELFADLDRGALGAYPVSYHDSIHRAIARHRRRAIAKALRRQGIPVLGGYANLAHCLEA